MKKIQMFSVLTLIFSWLLGFSHISQRVSAQTDLVKINVNVFIELDGNEGIHQDTISYDIIHYPSPGAEGQVIYSYRSDDPASHTELYLQPGEYKFRLFDGGGYIRNGQPIMGRKITMTGPNTNDDLNSNQSQDIVLESQGQVIQWGNGQSVFDFMFQVEQGANLYNPETGLSETDLNIVLADQVSIDKAKLEATQETTIESTEATTIETTEETTQDNLVNVRVVAMDPMTYQRIANVNLTINDQLVTTDENGEYTGQVPYAENLTISAEPAQGYQAYDELTQTLPVNDNYVYAEFYFLAQETTIEETTLEETTLEETTLEETTLEESTVLNQGSLVFNVLDENGQAIEGVVIHLLDFPLVTDQTGQATIDKLEVGEYSYQVQVPDGYQALESQNVSIQANEETVVDLQLTPQVQYGNVTFRVFDQNQETVYPASINFNGRDYPANQAGEIIILDIQAGETYNYSLKSLPENYEGQVSDTITVEEGENDPVDIPVVRKLQEGSIILTVLDQNQNPVPDVQVQFADDILTSDSQGQIAYRNIQPGSYTYSIHQLPENYQSQMTEQTIEVLEGQEATATLQVESPIENGQLDIKVIDQDGQAIEGVVITLDSIGELTTDNKGIVNFTELIPGDYNFSIAHLPQEYENTEQVYSIHIGEGQTESRELIVNKAVQLGQLQVRVSDDLNQAVPGARLRLMGTELTTNEEGVAVFPELEARTYELTLVSLPENYERLQVAYAVTVQANETTDFEVKAKYNQPTTTQETTTQEATTQETTTQETTAQETTTQEQTSSQNNMVVATGDLRIEPQQTLSPEESSRIEAEARQATKEFVDADTGISVFVNPADSQDAVKLSVKPVKDPNGFEGYDIEMYEIELLNRNNEPIQLNHVAEIKLPTRPVNSQLKVIHQDNQRLSSLIFSLHNQRVAFRANQLGTYGIVYGGQPVANSSSETSAEEMTQENKELAKTGESSTLLLTIIAVLALALGIFFLHRKNKD